MGCSYRRSKALKMFLVFFIYLVGCVFDGAYPVAFMALLYLRFA